ncbi:hypothetical protein [Serratia odorifera]|jgi:hypothetical protein|uniref:FaeA-like protein n=1 Tax=Serratia odorifera TaxID=618 RepID=A0A3S4HJ49_SEROD|nr:hypothetical protein [Serratia odorifera]MBJ2066240.1 hypothetical protein [Serratia odorifera]PNK91454.1 hypothetical protein CEQ31_018120 [Serratia odorifera]RII72457.1 hypothetical protein DX901_08310 [Serratia odorifera]VDZ55721.1 Uncharacterised protein [Serratia odorifera]HEJ9095986.1 hypothetical protein [Serratia odorifera]
MEALSPKKQEIQQLQRALRQALLTLSPPPECGKPPSNQHEWLSTRQLAEYIDVGVYRARNLLLDMVEKGEVIVTCGSVKNSLRWYPVLPTTATSHTNIMPLSTSPPAK